MKLVKKFESILEPVEPYYRLDLTGAAYSFSWQYDGKYVKVIVSRDPVCVAVCKQINTKISVQYFIEEGKNIEKSILDEHLIHVLGLSEDLSEFYELCKKDPLLKLADAIRGIHLRAADPWTAFLIAVSQQNASFKQGWSMLYRLYTSLGTRVYLQELSQTYILPPRPEDILKMGEKALQDCGYGYRARIILETAKRVVENPDKDFRQIIRNVKGVGPYTYGLTCVIAYRDYTQPVIDRWVRGLYEQVNIKNVEHYFKTYWKNYQGLVTWFLTILLDAEPLSRAIQRIKKGELKPKQTGLTPLTMWKHW